MSRLRAAFPSGFNDWRGNDFIKNDRVIFRSRISRCSSPFLNVFLIKSNFHIQNKLSDSANFSRIHLLSVKKRNLKGTAVFLNEGLKGTLFTQWYLMPLVITDSNPYPPVLK